MKNFLKNKRLFISVTFVVVLFGACLLSWKLYEENRTQEIILSKLVNACLDGVDRGDHGLVFQTLRGCVNTNMKYEESEEMQWNMQHIPEMYKKMLLFISSPLKKGDAPHAECSLQSGTLKDLLENMGYKVDTVTLIAMTERFHDHVVINVLNPSTESYELHDTLFDVHYVAEDLGVPLGIEEILSDEISAIKPCVSSELCGWELSHTAHKIPPSKMKHTLSAAAVKRNGQYLLFYNSNRFDPHKELTYKGETRTYCEKREKHCQGRVINLLESAL